MKKILNILVASVFMMSIGSIIVSCEDENIGLGSGLVGGDAEGDVASYDVIAFNSYADSIRSNQFVLQNALLGVYDEPVFGKTKASFISQLRLNIPNPNFGANAKVDSVNLIIPVYTKTGSDQIKTDTINLSRPGVKTEDSDTILIRTTYKVDSIYGNKDSKMTLNVRDINTILYTDQAYFSKSSNISVNPRIIGSGILGNSVQSIRIKQKNNSASIYEESAGYKISLDKNYFQEKIINNQYNGLLGDYATFLREVIKGFHFSVTEDNGFLFALNPSDIELRMHYSEDNTLVAGKRNNAVIGFNFASFWGGSAGPNVQISHLEHANKGAQFVNNLNDPNKEVNGSARLFLNGADGTQIKVKFSEGQINQLKADSKNNNWTIVGAKLKFFIDNNYGFPKPSFITAYNQYIDNGSTVNSMFADVTRYQNSYPNNVHFNPIIGDKDYYTLDITLFVKDIIEKGEIFLDQEMIVTMGNFLMSASDASSIYSMNPMYRNTVSNPYRIVLHGNAAENIDKKLKLLVYYTKK